MNRPMGQPVAAGPVPRPRRPGRLSGVVLVAGTVCLGMIAGMFFDWATAIMPALSGADDRTYLIVMQQTITTINASPLFMLAFLGAFALLAVAVLLLLRARSWAVAGWVGAALALYAVAVAITGVVHFPLNATLEFAGDPGAVEGLAALRGETEQAWRDGHLARTVATTLALCCACLGLLLLPDGREDRR